MAVQAVPQPAQKGSDYSRLLRRVRDAGLLKRRPVYYTLKIATTVLLFAAGWVALFFVGASWWNLVTAAYLAVVSTQIGFVGHDAGHKQIFRSNTASTRLSYLLGNSLIGLSTGWWNDKHNRHHANPNNVDEDPDVAVGALVFTKEQAAGRGSFGRMFARSQAYLFFPLLLLEGLNLHVASVKALFDRTMGSKRARVLEGALLLLHTALYLAAVFTVLTPGQGIAFIAVHQGLWGLFMGLSFAPNHKGMPTVDGDSKLDYLRKQVLTSRNIRGGWLVDWLLGGLNYQIEHHLFPNMPRPSLRRAQQIVEEYCREIGVSYLQTSAWRSYAEVLRHLQEVGA